MWTLVFPLLTSPKRDVRIHGWGQLRQDFMELQTPFTVDQWEVLTGLLLTETDAEVYRMAIGVILGFVPRMKGTGSRDNIERLSTGSLGHWLWLPFKSTSAMFGLSDPNYKRRDEIAIVNLARQLCDHRFPELEINYMQVDDPRWDQLLFRYQALCFVGRLGIFGDEAAQRWGNRECRFGFSLGHRPKGLPPGKLHRKYHCITEKLSDGTTTRHRTQDDRGIRMDFGLVQRYTVLDGTRRIPVVNFCGGSALGTWAATMWATNDLSKPLSLLGHDQIPMAPGLKMDSMLEALVSVEAEITGYAWQPKRIALCKLFAGRNEWNNDDHCWKSNVRVPIVAVMDGSEVVAVRIDGGKAPSKRNSQNFRLLAAILSQVLTGNSNVIDLKRLALDKSIWSASGRTPSEKEVRKSLANLRFRVLHECLEIGDEVILKADVTQVPANGS